MMGVLKVAADPRTPNYYAILQVHQNAEPEIIEAAYRQLMKRYHPDLAGHDPERIALHHERAKALNQAFSVLRDPEQRRFYDSTFQVPYRNSSADYARPATDRGTSTAGRPPPDAPPRAASAQTSYGPADFDNAPPSSIWQAPFAFLSAAYYLLPGPYEWDEGRHRELRAVFLLPPLGVAGFALSTGRLAPLVGHSPAASLFAWVILGLLSLPAWSSLFRLAVASVPTLVLLSGYLDPYLRQAHLPVWMAATLFGLLGLVLSARLYVFVVLPTLAACWLISSIS